MAVSLLYAINHVITKLKFGNNVDIKVVDRIWGNPINRRKSVRPIGLKAYLDTVPDNTRVATFIRELERRIGAQIGARIEITVAGHPIDGRRSIAWLR